MKEIELKGYKVTEVRFVNKVQGNQKLELSNKYSYNVGYSKVNTCKGEFRAEVADKNNPDQFSITVVLEGFFVTAADMAKEVLHIKTYDALFPYVKSFVSSLTVNAGVPPVMIPYVDISGQSIYRVEMPIKPNNE